MTCDFEMRYINRSNAVYREGNGVAQYFKLYLKAYLWSGGDPPRSQGHLVGKGISTQVMMSSHTVRLYA